jgi:Methyltransferase domain
VKILKTTVNGVRGEFGVVMFHHALEHVPDPVDTLTAAQMRLHPGGLCIVRVPTTSSEAWERYGKDWFQLDPPRHLLVPSRKGMAIMGQRSGLALEQVIDDSMGFQFWASEQYQRNIPLYGNGTCQPLPSRETLAEYETRAAELNARSRCLYLPKGALGCPMAIGAFVDSAGRSLLRDSPMRFAEFWLSDILACSSQTTAAVLLKSRFLLAPAPACGEVGHIDRTSNASRTRISM